MQAIARSLPPHWGQVSMSMADPGLGHRIHNISGADRGLFRVGNGYALK
jgi:hypothetical protein